MLIMMTLKDWLFQKCVVCTKFDIYIFTYFNLISHFTLSYNKFEVQPVLPSPHNIELLFSVQGQIVLTRCCIGHGRHA